MRKSLKFLLVAGVALTLFASTHAQAQATFYQVPSGAITAKGDIYIQQQSTLTDRLDLTLQGMLGVGSNVDLGVSIYNFDIVRSGAAIRLADNSIERREPFGPLTLATMQKRFDVVDTIAVLFGAQAGPNVAPFERIRAAFRAYGNIVVELAENRRCTMGAYLTNGIFVGGPALQYAPWVGCDIEIVDELLELQGDWDFGSHTNGVATFGPQLRVRKHIGIAAGVRAPNPWSQDAKWGGVLQLELKDPLTG